ncbi:MAG: hypothetical protein IJ757_04430 [Clostridiales bacterium]|nr:hypothetical protein [Clostridiales bacterium]
MRIRKITVVGFIITTLVAFVGCQKAAEESQTVVQETTSTTTVAQMSFTVIEPTRITETTRVVEETEATEETAEETLPDGTFVLPNTNIEFILPDGYTVTDLVPGYEVADASAAAISLVQHNTVFTAGYDDEGEYSVCGIAIIYMGDYDISSYDRASLSEEAMEIQIEAYEDAGLGYTRGSETITLNGYTYTADILETVPSGDDPSVATVSLVIGDEDVVYWAVLMSPGENIVEEFLNAFKEA